MVHRSFTIPLIRQLAYSTSLANSRRLLSTFRCSFTLYKFGRRLVHSVKAMECAPEPVIVNHVGDRVQLKFTYCEPQFNFRRVFNMDRSEQEQMSVLTARISSNIEKFLAKKASKVNKKNRSSGSPPVDAAVTQPAVSLLLDGKPAEPHLSCAEALVEQGARAALHIGRLRYRLSVNPPAVLSLSLPSSLMAGFPVHPGRLQLAFSEHAELCWQREDPSADGGWRDVGSSHSYTPSAEDIGHRLRLVCVPVNGERRGETVTVVSEQDVQAGPGPCPFDQRHAFTRTVTDQDSYRVVSYNILADLYADSDFTRTVLHPYCPPYALHIDYRKQLIVKELMGYNGDIVCLQEVDKKVYEGDLEPMFETAGLEGVFTPKGGQVTEGLVCFYRSSKLRMVDTERVVLGEMVSEDPLYADVEKDCAQNDQLRERLTKRTQTLQVNVLDVVPPPDADRPPRRLVVANTHLYFHPNADHIRALQIGICMRHLERLIERLRTEEPGREVALLFCGDFNSCPEFSVLRLMTTQRLEEDLQDFSSAPGEEVHGVSFQHPYRIASACGTPEYTNYVDKFRGCLDYIFYMTDFMDVQQVVPLPSHEEVTRHTALPSVVIPSDHLALVADLGWRPAPPN
ncbi:2',5'-phosphodiesterase 12-like isoform X2 [Amphibalanus amphitrite]|uniref:2',5'-phosphodiesterase 12-like isoform X2 n=2 Tax=Amphibalanus amphitrite TaxID=1232801 RepID=UPI001C9183F7|nr:2',5'-phosphodiesterase 12-like isoform X2 [Amphibalanus amphitrite]